MTILNNINNIIKSNENSKKITMVKSNYTDNISIINFGKNYLSFCNPGFMGTPMGLHRGNCYHGMDY